MWPSRFSRTAFFAAAPLLSIFTPFLALPALTSQFGAQGFASVALGQSLGAGAAVLVELGWGVNGPQEVARLSHASERVRKLSLAVMTQLPVWIAIQPILVLAAATISGDLAATYLAAASASTLGLAPSWYFVGCGRPFAMLATDPLMRAVGVGIGSALILAANVPLWIYPFTVLLGGCIGVLLGWKMAGLPRGLPVPIAVSGVVQAAKAQRVAYSGRLASALYLALPTAIIGVTAPHSVATFAAAERLARTALAALAFIPQVLQRWFGRLDDNAVYTRARMVALISAVGAVVASGFFVVFAEKVAGWVFSGTVQLAGSLTFAAAALILITVISRNVGGVILVRYRGLGWLAASASVGAMSGLPMLIVLSEMYGALGGLTALAAAEVLVLAVQLWGWRRCSKRIGN